MFQTRVRGPRLPLLFAAAALLAATASGTMAHAQVARPFQINGAGMGPRGLPLPGEPARPHWAIGNANYLGRYCGTGSVETFSAAPGPDGTLVGTFGSGKPFRFVAANGDVLVCNYGRVVNNPGTFILDPTPDGRYTAYWIAEFVPIPSHSTGRFRGVTGSWTMYAQSTPLIPGLKEPIAYSWYGEGTLIFPRGR